MSHRRILMPRYQIGDPALLLFDEALTMLRESCPVKVYVLLDKTDLFFGERPYLIIDASRHY